MWSFSLFSLQCKTGFAGDGIACGFDSDLDGWPDNQLDCEDKGKYTHCTGVRLRIILKTIGSAFWRPQPKTVSVVGRWFCCSDWTITELWTRLPFWLWRQKQLLVGVAKTTPEHTDQNVEALSTGSFQNQHNSKDIIKWCYSKLLLV